VYCLLVSILKPFLFVSAGKIKQAIYIYIYIKQWFTHLDKTC